MVQYNNVTDGLGRSWFGGKYITKENLKEAKSEISKLASMANKRLARLENANLTSSPAYKKWAENGQVKFGVKGKTHNELQRELSRLEKFLSAETSTVRGANATLKEMAKNTGIKYKNLADLRSKADKFFELSSKVEQYLRTVDDIASAIGYQKIWEAINTYVKDSKTDLSSSENDIDSLVDTVSKMLNGTNRMDELEGSSDADDGWFFV